MMMGPLPEDKANPKIAADYQKVHDGYDEIVKHYPDTAPIAQVDKYDFYDRTRKALQWQ